MLKLVYRILKFVNNTKITNYDIKRILPRLKQAKTK